ncbi:hypothetical protein KAR91_65820 [Candidatus Pacearchaeota archaeon]|nr:hypothetical protein [Candidatus Pacearchaeota archaeon]
MNQSLCSWLHDNHWHVYDGYLEGWTQDYSVPSDDVDLTKFLAKDYPELLAEYILEEFSVDADRLIAVRDAVGYVKRLAELTDDLEAMIKASRETGG